MNRRYACWTDDELKRLAAIVAASGTPLRAAAARNLGTPFTPVRITRKKIREKCAEAERTPVR
jgi:adenine/guanine phosphoribosyltransferase-like PRPP-binding protein